MAALLLPIAFSIALARNYSEVVPPQAHRSGSQLSLLVRHHQAGRRAAIGTDARANRLSASTKSSRAANRESFELVING